MDDTHFDVIIVGASLPGAAMLDAFAERVPRALLLGAASSITAELPPPEDSMLLSAWDEDWWTARLAVESLPAYRELCPGTRARRSLALVRRRDLAALRSQIGCLNARGAGLAILPPADLRRRFPERAWTRDDYAVVEDSAVLACPSEAFRALIARAVERGAVARIDEKATEIVRREGCVAGVRTKSHLLRSATCRRHRSGARKRSPRFLVDSRGPPHRLRRHLALAAHCAGGRATRRVLTLRLSVNVRWKRNKLRL